MEQSKSERTEPLKFLCSYGGRILPRHTDGKLRYVGGLTRVLSVDPSISYAELMVKLGEFCGFSVTLKCQLPGGDLETLVSIKSDEDLANLIEEYHRFSSSNSSSSPKIRAILSPIKSLKKVSPPPSVVDYGSPTSVFAGLESYPNRYVSLSCPVGHRRSFDKACYYPYHVNRSKGDAWLAGSCLALKKIPE
ncbi:hypothetical protein FNV43_RR20273 [Rhamnella rubrinervis]|uniref:PB1 domain-containing protein n=1 Tax=Rhamnella rubrinervis TaxID=2594499 RepID=A0A8K0E0C8_9ROSA|nr:hypothetical protein FNV43_RR20273 [Rhamnella rubrinervis]